MSQLIPPLGEYRYQLRRHGEKIGTEIERLEPGLLSGYREMLGASANRHEVRAVLSPEWLVTHARLSYSRGPFTRHATYAPRDELLQGSVSGLAGPNPISIKLGRFKEIDADLVLFKALIVAHVRQRGLKRWTGRVSVVDSATLVARSVKQTWFQRDEAGAQWAAEVAIGERETIDIDRRGVLTRRADSHGGETILISAPER